MPCRILLVAIPLEGLVIIGLTIERMVTIGVWNDDVRYAVLLALSSALVVVFAW